jgi:hypothetical protein
LYAIPPKQRGKLSQLSKIPVPENIAASTRAARASFSIFVHLFIKHAGGVDARKEQTGAQYLSGT